MVTNYQESIGSTCNNHEKLQQSLPIQEELPDAFASTNDRPFRSDRGSKGKGGFGLRVFSPRRLWFHTFGIAIACLLATNLTGCTTVSNYLGFWQKQRELKKEFQEKPSVQALRELRPEDSYLLVGPVTMNEEYRKPILVVAVTDRFKKREVVATRILQPPVQFYQAYLPEGDYDLYFFADLDGNGYFEAHEMIGRTSGKSIILTANAVKDGLTVEGPPFTLNLANPGSTDLPIKVEAKTHPYIFSSLDDPFFDDKYGTMGLWDPKAFMAHTQRFLFSLQEFDPDKTMVLFVHGVDGTPRNFKYLVDGLDKNRFQPWFYYYPSGVPLQKVGSLLADLMSIGTTTTYFQVKRLIVVAHSMGGLVALSGLNELCQNGTPPYLKGYISFNSPYGGVKGAQKGIENAPAVVHSWRDVAPQSTFLERLYEGKATASIPFYLFFGYETGESSDGTITLQSQLEPRIHFNAYKSYGFNTTHVGILNSDSARQTFYRTLDTLTKKP